MQVSLGLVYACCVIAAAHEGFKLTSQQKSELIDKILHRLDKLLSMFESDIKDINADPIMALRVMEDELGKLRESDSLVADDRRKLVNKLYNKVGRIINQAKSNHYSDSDLYEKQFLPLSTGLGNFQTLDHTHKIKTYDYNLNGLTAKKIYTSIFEYHTSLGDECFARLIGTYNSSIGKCDYPEKCLRFMTPHHPPADCGYTATHQLLYILVSDSKQFSCSKKFNKLLEKENTSMEKRVVELCTRIYSEADMNFNSGLLDKFSTREHGAMKDLFAESIIACSMVNFKEFLRADWIMKLLEWTDNPQGCLKELNRNNYTDRQTRRLLSDITMTGNCSSHASSMIGAALADYLYYLINS